MNRLASSIAVMVERLNADSALTRNVLVGIIASFVALVLVSAVPMSQTADESNHLATGLEWYQGSYQLHAESPPLARVLIAAGATLRGATLDTRGGAWEAGTRVLHDGNYRLNLGLARLGVLPFFVLLLVSVFWITRRYAGNAAALFATVVTASTPTLLGHASLATTDVPVTAMVIACFALTVCLFERPRWQTGAALGVGVGLGIATKFSFIPFYGCAFLCIAATRLVSRRGGGGDRWPPVAAIALAAVVAALTVWTVYQFSWGEPGDLRGAPGHFEKCREDGGLGTGVGALERIPLPAPAFWHGIAWLCAHNAGGHPAYLNGHIDSLGHGLFYAEALAFKTPLALLLVSLALFPLAIAGWLRRGPWLPAAAFLTAISAVVVATVANIHVGVRHVLLVYPLFAVAVTIVIFSGWVNLSQRLRVAAAALLLVLLITTARAHPHHLTYFNHLAGDEPGDSLVDSDLDWGQALLSLGDFVDANEIDELHVAYFGTARLCEHVHAELSWLTPSARPSGWIAISEMYFRGLRPRMYRDPCDIGTAYGVSRDELRGYQWLQAYQPVTRLDGSIRVYHLTPNTQAP